MRRGCCEAKEPAAFIVQGQHTRAQLAFERIRPSSASASFLSAFLSSFSLPFALDRRLSPFPGQGNASAPIRGWQPEIYGRSRSLLAGRESIYRRPRNERDEIAGLVDHFVHAEARDKFSAREAAR